MKQYAIIVWSALLLTILVTSCSEKELVMPEAVIEEELESLLTRPPLRPDSVEVYPAYYNAVEIVFPEEQPDRAVRAEINYRESDGSEVSIEVSDFDEVVTVDNLSLKPYDFTILYYNAEGKASAPVVRRTTPYAPLTDYPYASLQGYGEYGTAYVTWENITTKEVKIVVNYIQDGETREVSKRSAALRDTISIADLPDIEVDLNVQVTDLEKPHTSETKEFVVKPGIAPEVHALSTLSSSPGFGRAFLRWENPVGSPLSIKLSYTIGGTEQEVKVSSSVAEGTYTLTNLPEGMTDVFVHITNMATGKMTEGKLISVVADKGVKEVVSDTYDVSRTVANVGLLRGKNVTTVPVELTVTYQNTSGQENVVAHVIAPGQSDLSYLVLTDIKENSAIKVDFTDDIGTITKLYNSTVSTATDDWYSQAVKETWSASASSSRVGHLPSHASYKNFLPENVLDGITGDANLHWANEYSENRIDSLGTDARKAPHYVKIDMLEPRQLTGFGYVTNTDSFRPGHSYIEYSMDGVTFERIAEISDPSNPSNVRRLDVLFPHPVFARYVRMYIDQAAPGSDVVRVGEVYVKGKDVDWD